MKFGVPYYVIGHPLGHSMSPFIHTRLFAAQGHTVRYEPRDIPPERLEAELAGLLKEAGGLNVTIPYKQAVIPLLDGLRGRAELYRSVNTIDITEQGRFGYNTDAEGFLAALEGGGVALRGRVALLGCGGVGRTFACEAALAGCTIVNGVREADLPQGRELEAYVRRLVPAASYELTTLDRLEGDFDLLINATPVGMYPHTDAMPVGKPVLAHTAAVFDAVYNPGVTALLACAAANGARTVGGMPMLVWQAAIAHRIWYQAEFTADAMNALIDDSQKEMHRLFG
ncbi:MAG TPA: shikimate dehydrogenase [Firmicutes bacterium]|nr:shikimate dehydrogenase [Bacillota bacterium]